LLLVNVPQNTIWAAVAVIVKKRDPTVSTVLKFNRKIIEKGKIDTPTTYLHDQSLSWLGTDTSIKSGRVKGD
jgi:hypothetical protein